MVIDFRKLKSKTIADKYPMPSISMMFLNLGKARYFTTLDLKSGYHQINREKNSISANNGKYEFCHLPFGIKNASSIFQRAINDVSRDFIGQNWYVYVDDVIVFFESEKEHVAHGLYRASMMRT